MQDVTVPATPPQWEQAWANVTRREVRHGSLEIAAHPKVFRAGWDAAIASQAELVAAALAWYDDDITSVARRRADTALSKAVEAYRSARSA